MGPGTTQTEEDRDEADRKYEQDIADGNPDAFDPDDDADGWNDPYGNQNETTDGMD